MREGVGEILKVRRDNKDKLLYLSSLSRLQMKLISKLFFGVFIVFLLASLNSCGPSSSELDVAPLSNSDKNPQLNSYTGSNMFMSYTSTSVSVGSYILIPLYGYPTVYSDEYNKLLSLNPNNQQIMVIINPSNGPGRSIDENYSNIIRQIKLKGFKVFGYVYTSYGNRSRKTVQRDIDRYMQFYPEIDGIFFDEVSNDIRKFNYYNQLSNYARSYNKMVILNPGTNIPSQYFSIADFIVTFEKDVSELTENDFNTDKDKSCFLIYGVKQQQDAYNTINLLKEKGIKCLYITDKTPNDYDLWFVLSPYIHMLLEMF